MRERYARKREMRYDDGEELELIVKSVNIQIYTFILSLSFKPWFIYKINIKKSK